MSYVRTTLEPVAASLKGEVDGLTNAVAQIAAKVDAQNDKKEGPGFLSTPSSNAEHLKAALVELHRFQAAIRATATAVSTTTTLPRVTK